MTTGKVKWFNNIKKYGFIHADDGKEIFVHFSEIMSDGYKTLKKGDVVEFEMEHGPKGEKAVHVKKLFPDELKKKNPQLSQFRKQKRFSLHPGNGMKPSAN